MSRAFRPVWPIVRPLLLFAAIAAWATAAAKAVTGRLHWDVTPAGWGLAVGSIGVVCFVALLARNRDHPGPWRILLILGLPALAVFFVVVLPAWVRTTWTVGLVLTAIALVWFIADEFSGTFLRWCLVLFVVPVLVLVTLVGRDVLARDRVAEARRQATTLDIELAALADRVAEHQTAAKEKATTSIAALAAAAKSSPADVAARVGAVVKRLRSSVDGGPQEELESPAPDVDALFAAAVADVKAIPAALAGEPAQASIRRLCDGAAGTLERITRDRQDTSAVERAARCRRAVKPDAGGRALDLRAARAELTMANLDAVNSPADAAAAKKRREAAATELKAATADRSQPPPTVSVVSALSAGGDALVAWLPGAGSAPIDLELQAAGWIVLGILALYFARAMVWRSSDRGIGPVKIVAEDLDKDSRAVFEVQMIQNVPEPPTLPGTPATDPVTDLVAAAAEGTTGIAKALMALQNLFRPAARFEVQVDMVGPPGSGQAGSDGAASGTEGKAQASAKAGAGPAPAGNDATEGGRTGVAAKAEGAASSGSGGKPTTGPEAGSVYQCVVRVNDARRGETLQVFEECDAHREHALWRGAYDASGWILEHSHVVAPWAAWAPEASAPIARWRRLTVERSASVPEDDDELSPEQRTAAARSRQQLADKASQALEAASAAAPQNALLADALAHRLALEKKDKCGALVRYARTAATHPRNITARYQVAYTLSTIAADPDCWWAATPGQRQVTITALRRVAERAGLAVGEVGLSPVPEEWAKSAYRLAAEHMRDVADLCTRPRMFLNALRRDERSYWMPRAFPPWRTSWVRLTAETAHLFMRVRSGDVTAPRSFDVERYRDSWTALYNLACVALVPSDAPDLDTAMDLLERARDATGGGSLSQRETNDDPDLEPLKSSEWFKAFVKTLPEQGGARP